MTPLKPAMGYPLDGEDLSLQTRKQKITRLLNRTQGAKTIKGIRISALINDKCDEWWNLWTYRPPDTWILREEARRIFHHVFWVITLLGGGLFASRASWDTDSPPTINFDLFFPTDTGPLPQIETHASTNHPVKVNYGDEGLLLLLPKDRELLKATKAKFLFLPDANW